MTSPAELRIPTRLLLTAFGWCALLFSVAGVFVAGLPAVVFVLIASYCFSKCASRLVRWPR